MKRDKRAYVNNVLMVSWEEYSTKTKNKNLVNNFRQKWRTLVSKTTPFGKVHACVSVNIVEDLHPSQPEHKRHLSHLPRSSKDCAIVTIFSKQPLINICKCFCRQIKTQITSCPSIAVLKDFTICKPGYHWSAAWIQRNLLQSLASCGPKDHKASSLEQSTCAGICSRWFQFLLSWTQTKQRTFPGHSALL